MASLFKKRIGKNVYWYARECQRVNGKPKIVWQKYLGRADAIVATISQAEKQKIAPRPVEVRLSEFAGSAALYDLAKKLDLVGTIDRHVPKRGRGPTVGQYLTIATINRCLAPRSKAKTAEWFEKSVLSRLIPMKPGQLTSQRFWDNMDRVPETSIRAIEEELTARAVKQFNVSLKHLLFDATNFFTFIDTFNSRSTLAQRGKSKEGRAALRIVGLALLVTADFHVPLLHHTYPGNQPDSPTFASLTEELIARYRKISQETEHVTLVFDKGNNSTDNMAAIINDGSPFHFVGSLVHTQHSDLLEVKEQEFHSLKDDGFEGVSAFRTKRNVFGVERTVVVTVNENLFVAQSQTVMREVAKRLQRLRELQGRLRARSEGRIRGGKKPTKETVKKKVDSWLKAQHMRKLISVDIKEQGGHTRIYYRFNRTAWDRLQQTILGKTILFTDNHDWSDAQIVRAYRGQMKVEAAFRCMKDPHHLAMRPTFHWTDQKIKVHVFTCVIALMLASLIRRQLDSEGFPLSLNRTLDILKDIHESVVVYPETVDGQPVLRTVLSSMSEEQKRIFKTLGLARYRAP